MSEVGFEPTPSFEDQNAHFIEAKSKSLESGALDRSAILTFLWKGQFLLMELFLKNSSRIPMASAKFRPKKLRNTKKLPSVPSALN